MQDWLQDIRYGARVLVRRRGFTLAALITLALGVGANSLIFSLVNFALLRPLPYREPERLVMIWETYPLISKLQPSVPDMLDWGKQSQVFEGVAGYSYEVKNFVLQGGDQTERLVGAPVSAGLLSLLGVNPILGRGFAAEEDQLGHGHVVILGEALWRRRFAADPQIVGKMLRMNDSDYTVVGVMPRTFKLPAWAELWTPLGDMSADYLTNRLRHPVEVIARLKPGISLERVQPEMDTIASQLEQEYPKTNKGIGIKLVSIQQEAVAKVRPALLVLVGAVALVLLIACVNVANLLFARLLEQRRELAVRAALGATRARLIRQLLTESLLLSLIGSALGLALAFGGVRLVSVYRPGNIPRVEELGIDGRVVAFTLLISVVTGLAFGTIPALQSVKIDLSESLKEGSKGSGAGFGRHRTRNALVISEIALALMLLISAGLALRSFLQLTKVDLGFKARNVIAMDIALPESRYAEDTRQATFYRQVLERVGGLPGVEGAAIVNNLPLGSETTARTRFVIEGRPPWDSANLPVVQLRTISPDYFRAMGIALQRGRALTAADADDAPLVLVVNETMARRFWPGQDPLNQQIAFGRAEQHTPYFTIVGVVADVKDFVPDAEPQPEVYGSYFQSSTPNMTLVARTAADPAGMAAAVRNQVREVDKNQPVHNVRTMERLVADSLSPWRLNTLLLGVFAVVALSLASVGIYGVIYYFASQRTREIGIRIALGAQPGDVYKLIIKQGMSLTLVGVALGVAGAFACTRFMSSLLYGVSATDPLTFVGFTLTLILVALLACYLPARKAAKTDPMIALRYE